jgi:serine/threonine-protein kinase
VDVSVLTPNEGEGHTVADPRSGEPVRDGPPSTEANDPWLGVVVGERYRLVERLAEGGMGIVYRAEHVLMHKQLAVKVLRSDLSAADANSEVVQRFEREAQSASRLYHEHIVQVTDFGRTAGGELYLVMEYVRGLSLGQVLEAGRLPLDRAIGIIRQVLRALDHAHGQGIVHRDLKPDNVMVCVRDATLSRDLIKILDFGIAKLRDENGATERPKTAPRTGAVHAPVPTPPQLTQAGAIFGTPSYMAPEQALGDDVDARADLYAAGVLLFEMLTGRPPFASEDTVELLSRQLTEPPPSPRELAPEAGIGLELETVVLRALHKGRDQRYQTAKEFLAALDDVRAPGHGSALPRTSRRRAAVRAAPARLVDSVRRWAAGAATAVVGWALPKWRGCSPATRYTLVAAVAGALGICATLPFRAAPGGGDDGAGAAGAHPSPEAADPPPQLRELLQEATRGLARPASRGARAALRARLLEAVALYPTIGQARLLLGHLELTERRPHRALAEYREALRLDRRLRADPLLLRNLRTLLDDREARPGALELITESLGRGGCDLLAPLAATEKTFELRRNARDAMAQLECTARVDLVPSYLLDLAQGRTCEERRQAVIQLGRLGDPRALGPLRAARERRAGLFQSARINQCALQELDTAIAHIETDAP